VALATGIIVWLTSLAWTSGHQPAPRGANVGDGFKNVQVLKGIPVDEFMGTMGLFPRR
jgi:hypothetical protein